MKLILTLIFIFQTNINIVRSECLKEDNIFYPGFNINTKITGGVAECIGWCGQIQECRFWSFRKSNKQCWIKSSNANKLSNNNRISGSKGCATDPLVVRMFPSPGVQYTPQPLPSPRPTPAHADKKIWTAWETWSGCYEFFGAKYKERKRSCKSADERCHNKKKYFKLYKQIIRCKVCVKEDNIVYFGNDIYNKRTEGVDGCATWCGQIKECKYWTLNIYTNICYLKGSASGRRNMNGRISGNRDCKTDQPARTKQPPPDQPLLLKPERVQQQPPQPLQLQRVQQQQPQPLQLQRVQQQRPQGQPQPLRVQQFPGQIQPPPVILMNHDQPATLGQPLPGQPQPLPGQSQPSQPVPSATTATTTTTITTTKSIFSIARPMPIITTTRTTTITKRTIFYTPPGQPKPGQPQPPLGQLQQPPGQPQPLPGQDFRLSTTSTPRTVRPMQTTTTTRITTTTKMRIFYTPQGKLPPGQPQIPPEQRQLLLGQPSPDPRYQALIPRPQPPPRQPPPSGYPTPPTTRQTPPDWRYQAPTPRPQPPPRQPPPPGYPALPTTPEPTTRQTPPAPNGYPRPTTRPAPTTRQTPPAPPGYPTAATTAEPTIRQTPPAPPGYITPATTPEPTTRQTPYAPPRQPIPTPGKPQPPQRKPSSALLGQAPPGQPQAPPGQPQPPPGQQQLPLVRRAQPIPGQHNLSPVPVQQQPPSKPKSGVPYMITVKSNGPAKDKYPCAMGIYKKEDYITNRHAIWKRIPGKDEQGEKAHNHYMYFDMQGRWKIGPVINGLHAEFLSQKKNEKLPIDMTGEYWVYFDPRGKWFTDLSFVVRRTPDFIVNSLMASRALNLPQVTLIGNGNVNGNRNIDNGNGNVGNGYGK